MKSDNISLYASLVENPKPLILTIIVCIAMIVSTIFVWHLGGIPVVYSLTNWSDTTVLLLWLVIATPLVMLKMGDYFVKNYIRRRHESEIISFKIISFMTSICLTVPVVIICSIIIASI